VLDSLSPARRRLVLLVAGAATLLLVAVVGVVVVRARTGSTPVAQDRPGPVILVSGYGGSTRSLEPIRSTLQRAGRDVVVATPVGDGTGDIAAQAQDLGHQVDAALQRFGADSVDVVGYSAGGVVAREWVRSYNGAGVARRVLSVGSPQHGTDVAELGAGLGTSCPTACQQLVPDSDLLRALNARDETPAGPVFVSVWSSADEVVVPTGSARLAGAVNFTVQSVCPQDRSSHGGLPADPVVQAALASVLGPAAPRPPTDVPCSTHVH
jgi:triacylglycerol esterase/lipase EstA (alpha/beta hydrolase family)